VCVPREFFHHYQCPCSRFHMPLNANAPAEPALAPLLHVVVVVVVILAAFVVATRNCILSYQHSPPTIYHPPPNLPPMPFFKPPTTAIIFKHFRGISWHFSVRQLLPVSVFQLSRIFFCAAALFIFSQHQFKVWPIF